MYMYTMYKYYTAMNQTSLIPLLLRVSCQNTSSDSIVYAYVSSLGTLDNCVYNVHVVVHDCTVIIIHVHVHVHVSGPVDGSKRHIFQLISLAY